VLDPFDHPFEDPARRQQARRQRLVVEGRSKAEDIGIKEEACPHAGGKGIAVDADDAGQGAPVRIESGRGVVGLHLEDQTPVVGKTDDPGIVLEDRKADIVLPLGRANILGGTNDITLEEGVDHFPFPGGGIEVIDARRKNLMFAVFAPGLGEGFDLAIGEEFTETDRCPRRQHLRIADIGLNRLHFFEVESEHAGLAQGKKLGITNIKIDLMHLGRCGNLHFRHNSKEALDPVKAIGRNDRPALNQAVGKEPGGNLLSQGDIDGAGKKILHRGIDPFASGKRTTDLVLDCLFGSAADVVGDTRTVTNLDKDVEISGQGSIDRHFLDDRIAKRSVRRCGDLCFRQGGIDGVDVEGLDGREFNPEVYAQFPLHPGSAGIPHSLFQSYFYAPGHVSDSCNV
jgi:hypothetical protein